ncbi:hypothetical protein MATL_G00023350 [Megalops atlanticus]|uniref:C-C motif chemokine n=1 Tax=Megalops atlanticus TaxID=7932 RepID=A0A9D3QFW2_MEGAT|nr:hypothetical protein MATL_G00023350 [Megalops atlanticus]
MKLSDAVAMAAAAIFICTITACVSASHVFPVECCLRVSEIRLPPDRIKDYTVQKAGVCPVNAIVFLTRTGKLICSDPEKDWVKRAVRRVDRERKPGTANWAIEDPMTTSVDDEIRGVDLEGYASGGGEGPLTSEKEENELSEETCQSDAPTRTLLIEKCYIINGVIDLKKSKYSFDSNIEGN